MSRFKTVVPVPLGEIRRIEGKLGASAIAGQLVTEVDGLAAGDGSHVQNSGATLALNAEGNLKGVRILMEQEDMVTSDITATRAVNTWGRAHVLKSGEEVTVILGTTATAAAAGTYLAPGASGKVVVTTTANEALFTAIEAAPTTATGDALRILARVL